MRKACVTGSVEPFVLVGREAIAGPQPKDPVLGARGPGFQTVWLSQAEPGLASSPAHPLCMMGVCWMSRSAATGQGAERGLNWSGEGLRMETVVWGPSPRPPWGVEEASALKAQKRGGDRHGERGGWMLTSASSRPAGGVLWNVMRSWPGSGRPTSTPSTSSWDQGSMSRGPARRPQTWLLKVGVQGGPSGHDTCPRPLFLGFRELALCWLLLFSITQTTSYLFCPLLFSASLLGRTLLRAGICDCLVSAVAQARLTAAPLREHLGRELSAECWGTGHLSGWQRPELQAESMGCVRSSDLEPTRGLKDSVCSTPSHGLSGIQSGF